MNSSFDGALHLVQGSLLRCASLLVPAEQREDWADEWSGELWHVRDSLLDSAAFSWDAEREVIAFCLGAFPDALCVRSQAERKSSSSAHIHQSAGQCLLWLSTILAVCGIIAQLLPGVQAEKEAAQFRIRSDVLSIVDSQSGAASASISTALYRDWRATRQRYFDDLAFYRVSRESVSKDHARKHWRVAHATPNLFSVLGLPIQYSQLSADDFGEETPVILGHEVWMRDFGGSPQVAGTTLRIGEMKVRIAGIAPAGAWHLSGDPEVWLLQPAEELISASPSQKRGFLLAKLSERGKFIASGRTVSIDARGPADSEIELYGTPLEAPVSGPWSVYAFALFLALLALPAVTSVSLGESSISMHRASAKQRLYRGLFLLAKFFLIAMTALYASLDIAYWYTYSYSPTGEFFQLIATFAICLFGFRWALADQRQRCPVCLRRVTHPARVGLASRTFLGWNGTELICMGGHTLLHVPSLPTSWFSSQRWLYLDSSWEFLFADTHAY